MKMTTILEDHPPSTPMRPWQGYKKSLAHQAVIEVAKDVGITTATCRKILNEDVSRRNMLQKRVPSLLTAELNEDRVSDCTDLSE